MAIFMNQPRVLVFTKSKNTSGITLPNSRISFPLTSHSISTKSGAVEGPSLEGSRFWENPNSYIKHVAIFMNQPAPPPPIQSLQNQGPWRVRKSPGFNKIKKYTWHHFAKFKNILPPHLPLNLYKRGRGGSQLGRVGRVQVFGKSKQVKHVAIFMNQPSPPHQGPWRVLSWQSGRSPGFYKIQKDTWHHIAKFKNILPPHLPLNLYKIRGRGGSQLGRVGRVQVLGKSKQLYKACGHIHESACPTTSHSISTKSGPLEGPEESWF